jgi:hypothetical protein
MRRWTRYSGLSRSKNKGRVRFRPQSGRYLLAAKLTGLPSRPGEFRPEPLTDPDVNLSIHPARAIARRLPPSTDHRAHPVAGWPDPMAMACPLRSTGITPLHH